MPNQLLEQKRIEHIAHHTEFFIRAIGGSEQDIADGISESVRQFRAGSSAACAIYKGWDLIRKRQQRLRMQELLLQAVIASLIPETAH